LWSYVLSGSPALYYAGSITTDSLSMAANDWSSRSKASGMYHKSAPLVATVSGHWERGQSIGNFNIENVSLMFRGGTKWCGRRGCGFFGDYPWCAEASGTWSGARTSQSISVQGSESLFSKTIRVSRRGNIIVCIPKRSISITCTSQAATMNRQSMSPPGDIPGSQ
jgi:hypothetical protein